LGLFWTTDYGYGLHDLKIKLPLLWFPLLFFTTQQILSRKEITFLLHCFVSSVVLASIICTIVWLGLTKHKVIDIRDISIFNSHIRFSLMIDLSIAFVVQQFSLIQDKKWKIIMLLIIGWLISFLFIMQSVTGIILLFLLLMFFALNLLLQKTSFVFRITFSGILIAISVMAANWLSNQINQNHILTNSSELKSKTASGKMYFHDTTKSEKENGNLVWINICYDELSKCWNERSNLKYEAMDKKGNPIFSTLIRFLASKGLTKDSVGVTKLTDLEIQQIENGTTNYMFSNKSGIKNRINDFIHEYEAYKNHSDPSGHTLLMRLEFWKTGWNIIKKHYVLGVGTGDVQQEYNRQYQIENTKLSKDWWKRSHNQFMSITIALGFFGLIVFVIYLITPLLPDTPKHSLFFAFYVISILSMFTEDTLETQAGVTFFGFFFSLLTISYRQNNIIHKV